MRALFLVPPTSYNARNAPLCRVYGCNWSYDLKPPIHLLGVATYAREELGWDVRVLDCPAEGLDARRFEELVSSERYDVVLHWVTYLSAIEDLRAARFVRDHMPGSPKHVFMGAAPSWRHGEFGVDRESTCLIGEPEHTLRDLDAVWNGTLVRENVPGLGWFDDSGQAHRGGFRDLLDVSALPFADRRLLRGRYHANRLEIDPITVMVVSRGCGFRCTFCATNAMDQAIELEVKRGQAWYVKRPPLRKRTPEQVVAEMEDIASLGIRGVEIADNVFTWGKTRTLEICKRIEPLGLKWLCLARANMLHDPQTVGAMGKAGCVLVYMGSESFDDGLLDDMAKEIKVRDVRKAVEVCTQAGVEPEVSVLMGGSPHETWSTLIRSWKAARSLGTRFVHYSAALPVPSSELYDMARQQGWFVDGDFYPCDNQREVIVNLPHLSAGELRLALKLATAAQYLTPGAAWSQAKGVRSPRAALDKARAATRLLRWLAEGRDRARAGEVPPGQVAPTGWAGESA